MFANLRGIGRKKRPAQLAATKHLFDAIVPDFSTRLQPHEHMEMAVEHSKAADGNGEVRSEQLQSVFDPLFAIFQAISHQIAATNAATDAVVPASDGGINDFSACSGHGILSITKSESIKCTAAQSFSRKSPKIC